MVPTRRELANYPTIPMLGHVHVPLPKILHEFGVCRVVQRSERPVIYGETTSVDGDRASWSLIPF